MATQYAVAQTPIAEAGEPARRKAEISDADEYQAVMHQLHQTIYFCDSTAKLIHDELAESRSVESDYSRQMAQVMKDVISKQYDLLERLGGLGESFWFGDFPSPSPLAAPNHDERMYDYLMEIKGGGQ